MDGQRLTLDGNTLVYGSDGAVYRTELDSFSRVTSIGTTGGGPTRFKAETKTGWTIDFGNSVDSRMVSGPAIPLAPQPLTVVMWATNRIADRLGNAITYSYLADFANGSHYPSRIEYNGGKAYVKFEYVDDPNPRLAFIAGTKVTQPKLLSRIATYVLDDAGAEKQVKTYRISYDMSDVKGDIAQKPVARATSITECDATDQCLNPIIVSWQSWSTSDRKFDSAHQAGSGTTMSQADGWNNENYYYRRFADLNGDGRLDIVGFASNGVYVLFSKDGAGSGAYESARVKVSDDFGHGTGWEENGVYSVRPRHIIDMNRDGYPDIVGMNNLWGPYSPPGTPAQGVYLSTWDPVSKTFRPKVAVPGGGFFTTEWGSNCGARYDSADFGSPKHLVDMNNDGYPDLVGFHRNGVYIAYWDGTKFGAPFLASSQYQMKVDGWLGASNQCYGSDIQPVFLEDMNGDGFPDIVGIHVSGVYVALWNPATSVFNTALPPYTEIAATPRGSPQYPVQLADMNADGYPDLVQFGPSGVRVALWNGRGFNPSSIWTTELAGSPDFSRNPRRIADINGDGYPDVINFANDGVYVALSNGRDGFTPQTRWTIDFRSNGTDVNGTAWGAARETPRYVADVNGDGIPEVIGFGSNAVRWTMPAAFPGPLVTAVTGSLGDVTTFSYTVAQPYGGSYTEDAPAAVWPLKDLRGPTFIVSSIQRDNGTTSPRKTRYRYGGRKSHQDNGPLGFRWIAARDETTGIETYTEYEQTYPHVGAAKKSESRKSSMAFGVEAPGCICNQHSVSAPLGCISISGQNFVCSPRFTVTSDQLLARSTNTRALESLGLVGEPGGNTRYFTYLKSAVDERWEWDGTALPIKTTTFAYEEPRLVPGAKQWGNLTQKKVVLSDGNSSVEDNSFEPAVEAGWILGRISKTTATTSRPTRTITVAAPSDAAAPPQAAGALPISAQLLSVILSILLDD